VPFLVLGSDELKYLVGMESVAAAVVALAILLAIVFVIVFDVFCLVLLGAKERARFLPRWIWAFVIICLSPIGGAAFLISRRNPKPGIGSTGWTPSG
jgi:energy-coupling factor transporter transmembrane protein EcfT